MGKCRWIIIPQNRRSDHSVLAPPWGMIDTIAGAETSAIIYSIAENAKANSLKPYNYFEYLLTEIQKHMDDHDANFCEDMFPWSDKFPAEYRK